MCKSTALKFKYADLFVLSSTLIYKYRLQWVWVQRWHQTHNIPNMFDSYPYTYRFINLKKNTYKWFEALEVSASKVNTQSSTEYCNVRMRNILILCFMYMSILMVISFLQRKCHPVTWCIKKIADQPCYNVIFYLRRTEHKY